MINEQTSVSGRGQHLTLDTGAATIDAAALETLARELQHLADPGSVLTAIVAAAVTLVPGAEEGSISVVRARRHITSEAPTGDLPRRLDALQEAVQQGPCRDAAHLQQTVRVNDLSREQRWPLFTRRAVEVGVASILSLQLYVQGDALGSLNLYARTPHAFDDDSEHIGLLVAGHAAIAYISARKEAQLIQALFTRDTIGQAKGILMERYHITGDRAFLLLTRVSQNTNRKLLDVATELIELGTIEVGQLLPLGPEPRRSVQPGGSGLNRQASPNRPPEARST